MNKKVPIRRCTGCGESKPKNELVRIVRSPEGECSVDLTGKKSGRGAYVCKSSECLKKALRGRLGNCLGCEIDPQVRQRLTDEIGEAEKN